MRDVLKYLKCFVFIGVLSTASMLHGVNWTGNVNTDVTDDDIAVTGNTTLTGNVVVTASAGNTVNMTNAAGSFSITNTDGVQLNFVTGDASSVINWTFTNDLTFASGTGVTQHFLITFTGQGTLNITLSDGKTLTLSGNGTNSFGSHFLIGMNAANTSKVTVNRAALADATNTIALTLNSMIAFMATTASTGTTTEDGQLDFLPSSSDADGAMVVNVGDDCSFLIQGYQYSGDPSASSVSVDYTTPAGREALVRVIETDASAAINSLRVINANKEIPRLYRNPWADTETYTGIRPGFILGSNGYLNMTDNTYLDYIGTTTNRIASPTIPATLLPAGELANEVIKERNGSAFIVDGWNPNTSTSGTSYRPAKVFMSGNSGMFFRSGVTKDGNIYNDYAMAVTDRTQEAGEIVFDVEAELSVSTSASGMKVWNILSRKVDPSGGLVEIGQTPADTVFPKIIDPQASTRSYNTACFLINDQAHMDDVILRHDDYNRIVYDMNSPESAPTYIGGESFKLLANDSTPYTTRPAFRWYNSRINLHNSAAVTGVDWFFTNLTDADTTSTVAFYQNGYLMEQSLSQTIGLSPGRNLVMGTTPGSVAEDGTTVVDRAAYFDVFQSQAVTSAVTNAVDLIVAPNDSTQLTGITGDISTQYTVQTLFMGHKTNIQVGQNDVSYSPVASSILRIGNADQSNPTSADFFSFETQGGTVGLAELSGSTGEGGIFVDSEGTMAIGTNYRCNMGCMVTKSNNGIISLDKNKVFFDSRVGITEWNLDFSTTTTIVASGASLSDFTMDWKATLKDYAGGFVPFEPTTNNCPAVTNANMFHVPIVNGVVDQFQVKRSRLGDQFHLIVDDGRINELILLNGYDSSEAPVGVLFIQNNGRVGIGNNSEDADSMYGSVRLGVNGLTLAPNGDGVVDILSDVVIDNVCHIAPGPEFGVNGPNKLILRSQQPQEIRVRTGGTLDLSQFDTANKQLYIGGELSIVMERDSKLIMGGGLLDFIGQGTLTGQPYVDEDGVFGSDVTVTDTLRVKLIGSGEIKFEEDSVWFAREDTYWGIETDSDNTATNLTFTLEDSAAIRIGNENEFGGSIQVGNTADGSGHSITARFELNGPGATLNIGSSGFFGTGAGIVQKGNNAPDNWAIGSLFNLNDLIITNSQGTIEHNNILLGSDVDAALFAVGPAGDGTDTGYHLNVDPALGRLLGGGNMVRIGTGVTSVAPVVATATGASGNLADRGILASSPLLADSSKILARTDLSLAPTPTNFFNYLETNSVADQTFLQANIAPFKLASAVTGYVNGTTINRDVTKINTQGITNINGNMTKNFLYSFLVGAVSMTMDVPNNVIDNYAELF